MNKAAVAQQTKAANFAQAVSGVLQRKCACGNHTPAGGECAECAKKGSGLQRRLAIGARNDPLEQEADRVADQVMAAPVHSAIGGGSPRIRRFSGESNLPMSEVPATVDLASAAPGRRLEPTLRRNKEQRFSLDFSRIQVRSDTTAEQAARSASFSTQTKFGSESRGTLIHRADSDGKRGGTAPPANAPSAPSKVPQSATAPVDPIMASGSIDIKAKPLTLEQQGGQILALTMGFKIAKPFTVKASAQVQEPPDAEPFEYGIVQNVFFDHIEEAYSDGDMLVDSVGPLVDCDSGEQPFIHANAVMPETLFTTKRVGPSFTDIPSLEVMLHKLHCEKKKSVELKSVNRSVQFRAGLVARGLKTGRLVPLGNTQTTYGFDSEVIFTGPAFKSTDRENLTGSFPLSTSAPAVVTGGAIANDDGQAALNSETARFEQRCENVL